MSLWVVRAAGKKAPLNIAKGAYVFSTRNNLRGVYSFEPCAQWQVVQRNISDRFPKWPAAKELLTGTEGRLASISSIR